MSVESVVRHDGAVIEIVINRPLVHNALDAPTLDALQLAFDAAQRAGARIVVLKGEGRSFSSGADRRAYPGYSSESRGQAATQADIGIGNRVCRAIAQCNAITVARLQGHVLGGGLALALACDIRIAARDAVMGLPEVELSVPLGWGALYRLMALVGRVQAMELLLTPKRLSGEAALAIGLANACVDAAQLDECIEQRIAHLAGLDPNALLLTKLQFKALAAASTIGDIEAFDGQVLLSALRSGAYDRFAANR